MWHRIASLFTSLVRRSTVERELDEELRDHVERDVAARMGRGMSPGEARRAALAELGGVEGAKDGVRDARGITTLENFGRDVRFAFRRAGRSPWYTGIVVLTLGLGIGAATAVFSAVDGVLLKPLPFPAPDQLVTVWQTKPADGIERDDFAPGTFIDLQARARSFSHLAAANPFGVELSAAGLTEHIEAWQVSEGFLDLLGVRPHIGRTFQPQDFRIGGEPVILLDHGFWQRRYGGDPGIVGRQVVTDGRSVTVVGVLPPGFALPEPTNIWMPWTWTDDQRADRFATYIKVYGRLRDDATVEQAQTEVRGIADRLAREYPRSNAGVGFSLVRLDDFVIGSRRPLLWTLLGAAAILVLVTLANVGALHLTRLVRQRRETQVRAALGASRGQLARPLLAEALVLGAGGGMAGLALGWLGVRTLHALAPQDLPRLNEIALDWRAGFATALLALAASATIGLLGLARTSRERIATHQVAGSRLALRTRRAAVAAQLALGLVLLIGTSLLVRSFVMVMSSERGYRTDHLLSFSTWVYDEYSDGAKRLAFVTSVMERLAALPGVASASMGSALPLADGITGEEAAVVPDGVASDNAEERRARGVVVWPSYFQTLGIALRSGRGLALADDGRGEPVVVVNETFAARYFPGQDPVGRMIGIGLMGRTIPRRVVGVVADTRHARLDAPADPAVYIPWPQQPLASLTFIMRTSVEPGTLVPAVSKAMYEIDPGVGLGRMATLDALVELRLRERRFMLVLLATFAVTAVMVAAVGVFGVMTQSVIERSREIGVRMALGARPGRILSEFLSEAGVMTAIAVVAGLGLAVVATRALTRFLYSVAALDALSIVAAVGVLLALALLAAMLPSLRAARTNPARVLQES
jgi:putative ABC transport system permease protein